MAPAKDGAGTFSEITGSRAVRGAMTAGRYRAVFHADIPAGDAFAATKNEIRAWLKRKHLDVDAFAAGLAHVGARKVLLHATGNASDGTQTERWQLRDHQPDGHWLSSLVVHTPGRTNGSARTWFWLDVEFVHNDSATDVEVREPRGDVPHFVRQLLQAVEASDSLMILHSSPRLICPHEVDGLINVLRDPGRRLPAIVASAHPRIDFDEWRRTIEHSTRFVVGQAGVYILDPPATGRFNDEIGDTHGVCGGAVRTYLPDMDTAVPGDAPHHPVMSAADIEAGGGRASAVLAALPREMAADAPLPNALANIPRWAHGSVHRSESDAEVTPAADSVEGLQEDNNALFELLEEKERIHVRDQEELAEKQQVLECTITDLAQAIDRNADLENRVRYFRARAEEAGQTETFPPATTGEERLPRSFSDVIRRLPDLTMVEFTGDTGITLGMERKTQQRVWAQYAWQALRALDSYAEAKAQGRFHGDFTRWCEEPPASGLAVPVARVAAHESKTVHNNPRMRQDRELRVPEEVHPSGKVFMESHVRIGGGNGVAPRLHFYDDTSKTGKIYVGYLGPHLLNTRST
jgi:hypothetical protein